jgi:hypothetical protein
MAALIVGFVLWRPQLVHSQQVLPCSIGSGAGACVFDLEASADGTLIVDTRASVAGQRWRAIIAITGAKAIKGGLGSGSTTNFTGPAKRAIAAGKEYEVAILYDTPLPSAFPTPLEVRFNGPVSVTPRVSAVPVAARYVGIFRVPLSGFDEFFNLEPSADRSHVARVFGSVSCTDRFPFDVNLDPDVLPIDGEGRFSATGISIAVGTILDVDGIFLDADTADGTFEQALGGLTFTRVSHACPYQWWATTDPDTDDDGWNNRAEQRLGSQPAARLSIPEHIELPRTPFYGPVHCEDGADNDLDGLTDGDDPSCTAALEVTVVGSGTSRVISQ